MKLDRFLAENRTGIIKKWHEVIVSTYPDDTQRFFKREKNSFANPVGCVIDRDIETLFDALVPVEDRDKITECLDNIIRIRAVQDFSPSQATSFVLELKEIIREKLVQKSPIDNDLGDELYALGKRIDEIALLAFDIYSRCRQKIYEIRVNEVKNQVGRLLKRANLTVEIPEAKVDL